MINPRDLKTGQVYWRVNVTHLKALKFMHKAHQRKKYVFLEDGKKTTISEHDLYVVYENYNEAAQRVINILERYAREYKKAIEEGQDKSAFIDGMWYNRGYD